MNAIDVLETAVVAGALLIAQWRRHEHLAAERKHAAAQAKADRDHGLALAKAGDGK